MRVSQHRPGELADGIDRRTLAKREIERRQCPPLAELGGDLGGAVAAHDPSPAEAAFDPVDLLASETRVRRAKMREELGPLAADPREAKQRQEGVAVRRRPEPRTTLECHRHADRRERGPEREPDRVDGRTDDRDLVGRRPRSDLDEHRLRDELERAAGTGSLEPAQRAVERRAPGRFGEQRPLDVRERRREELLGAWRKLDDVLAGERGEIVDRPAERRVDGAAGLVGDRHVHLRARGERLEQAPLDAGEVLEAVREDRAVCPGPEIARQPLYGAAPKHATVPSVDAVQLRAIRRRERGERLVEVTWLEQRAVQLCQRAPDGVREARETRALGGRPGREPSDENASLGVTHEARARPLSPGEVLEERVERADRPGEQATTPLEQLPLDPLDVGALRDDQPRIAVERCDEAIE